jgi:NTP pyrophosphatase (non-canonical NTP hydrolase)
LSKPWEINVTSEHVTVKPTKRIYQYQSEISEWSKANFNQDPIDPLLGIGEEVGELMHAVLKQRQGIRKGSDPEATKALIEDSLGDLFIYMCDFCSRNNIDLEFAIRDTWDKVSKRDWQTNKVDGSTPL